jgi:DNA-binding NarL/FixJ family response regulator
MPLRFPRDTEPHLVSAIGAAPPPRLIIVDDDPVVRAALMLDLQDDFHVVGQAATAEEAVALARATRPDAALVDVDMPGGGPAAVRGILGEHDRTVVVALSVDESPSVVWEMLDAGASSYRRKQEPRSLVVEALRRSIRAGRR